MLTSSEHFWTNYLPCLVNVVYERPLTDLPKIQGGGSGPLIPRFLHPWRLSKRCWWFISCFWVRTCPIVLQHGLLDIVYGLWSIEVHTMNLTENFEVCFDATTIFGSLQPSLFGVCSQFLRTQPYTFEWKSSWGRSLALRFLHGTSPTCDFH